MIPKVIHYCWFGGEKPDIVKKCIGSWKLYCKDYEIMEWNESNFDVSIADFTREAFEHEKYSFLSDFVRYYVLYAYGGIYLDADVEIICSLDELLDLTVFMAAEDDYYVATGLGMGAIPNHFFIKKMLSIYQSIHCCDEMGKILCQSAPLYTTNELIKLGYRHMGNKVRMIDDITIFPQEYFSPASFWEPTPMITDHTFGWHHGMASWIPQLLKQERESYVSVFKVIFISPHFDDAIGSCAGWIGQLKQNNANVEIVTVMSDCEEFRHKEDEKVCNVLDVNRKELGIKECIKRTDKDGNLLYPHTGDEFMLLHENDYELQDYLLSILENYDRQQVRFYFPAAIGHQVDHIILYNIGVILYYKGWKVTFYSDFSYNGNYPQNMKEIRYPLTKEQQSHKKRLIEMYSSQILRLFETYEEWEKYCGCNLSYERYYVFQSVD